MQKEKVFYFYAFKVTTIKMNASEKAYNCHQKKIILAYIFVKLKKTFKSVGNAYHVKYDISESYIKKYQTQQNKHL